MSGRLTLRVAPAVAPAGAAVAVQVHDHGRGESHTVAVGTEPTTMELEEGVFSVQGWLPTGTTVTGTVHVTSGADTALTLGDELATEEPVRAMFIGGPEVFDVAFPSAPEPAVPETDTRSVWLALWEQNDRIELEESSVAEAGRDGTVLELPLDPGPFALQIGGPDVPWHVVAVPPSRGSRVKVRAVAPDTGQHDGGVRVDATTSDPQIEVLLGYLETGQLEQAHVIGGGVVAAAVQLFASKMARPEGAAVAGYYLLRIDEADRVRDWPDNFANWFPWLPDAHIIRAWTLLQQPDVPRRTEAREALLAAVETGILPRYSEGVRLLGQGLRMFAVADRDDEVVQRARATVRDWAMACDLTRPVTTYRATVPGEPSPDRVTGVPDDDVLELRLPLEYEPQRGIRPREREVLGLLQGGLTTVEVADRLAIAPKTVEKYVRSSLQILKTSSVDAAATLAQELDG